MTQEEILEESKKCKENPYYFATKYLTIKNHKGEYIPFQTILSEEEFNEKVNNMAKIKYDVLSPDGFSIFPTLRYSSKKEANEAFNEWKKKYEQQGYYSSNKGRIELKDLKEHCKFIEEND